VCVWSAYSLLDRQHPHDSPENHIHACVCDCVCISFTQLTLSLPLGLLLLSVLPLSLVFSSCFLPLLMCICYYRSRPTLSCGAMSTEWVIHHTLCYHRIMSNCHKALCVSRLFSLHTRLLFPTYRDISCLLGWFSAWVTILSRTVY